MPYPVGGHHHHHHHHMHEMRHRGGCEGHYGEYPRHGEFPRHDNREVTYNLPNANVGQHGWFGMCETKGFALDLNRDGRYEAGQDGVLAFDLNRDGRTCPREIEHSRKMLKAFGGDYDLNGDGRVSPCERCEGRALQHMVSARYDVNHDGVLDKWELQRGGAHVLVDRNRDGHFQPWEQHSVYNFPTPGYGRGSLDFVDPYAGVNGITNHHPWHHR